MNFSTLRSGTKLFRAMGSRQFSKGHSQAAELAEASRWFKVSVGRIFYLYIYFSQKVYLNI